MSDNSNGALTPEVKLHAKGVAADAILGALIARLELRLPGLREEVRADVQGILSRATADRPNHPVVKEALRAAEVLLGTSSI